MPTNDLISECREKMKKAAGLFHDELKGVRTGRASTGLVENLKVEYYGTPTPLKQMATLAAPQPDMVVIKPFDPSSVKDIEKAIKASDLSIAPVIDGQLIRLNVPALSEERRTQLAHSVKQMGEQAKVSIRNIRRDVIKQLEKEQKDKLITEDDLANGKKKADEITKESADKVDVMVHAKSEEIMLE